jgi:putative addiction module component (TIGR02574 family)
MNNREEILERALALPIEDRAFVADLLERSLLEEPAVSADVTSVWVAEINRRIESIDRGTAKAVDPETVVDRIRERLSRQRAAS